MRKNIWGLCLVLCGVGLFGNFTGLFNVFFRGWWTLFIILPAATEVFSTKKRISTTSRYFFLFILSVGVVLLLSQQGIIAESVIWKSLLALIVTLIGVNVMFRKKDETTCAYKMDIENKFSNDFEICYAIFGESLRTFSGEVFRGINLRVEFGAVVLDVRNAIIEDDAYIDISNVFGGCEIFVPKGINVVVKGNNVFGGVINKNIFNIPDAPTIYLTTKIFCGGVEIKN
jgi:predicted membrane protein